MSDLPRRRSYFSRENRRFTVIKVQNNKIELSKYKTIEDVTGEHLDVDVTSLLPPPPGFTNNDWIIINLVDFLQRVELLYSSCSLFCTSDTCPLFNAGPRYCYFWLDDDSSKSLQVSAPEYFDALKRYIKRNLNNKSLFPDDLDDELSSKAVNVIQTSYRRLFRILAHLYVCHFKDISKLGDLNFFEVMNTILTHYANIALIYNICSIEDFDVFEPIFSNINSFANPNFYCPKLSHLSKKDDS